MVKALVFDAYGTLFDVHSVLGRCEEVFPGHGSDLTSLWRSKQLQYTWLRSLMDRYEDFWRITEEALRFACAALALNASQEQIDHVMQAYLSLTHSLRSPPPWMPWIGCPVRSSPTAL